MPWPSNKLLCSYKYSRDCPDGCPGSLQSGDLRIGDDDFTVCRNPNIIGTGALMQIGPLPGMTDPPVTVFKADMPSSSDVRHLEELELKAWREAGSLGTYYGTWPEQTPVSQMDHDQLRAIMSAAEARINELRPPQD